MITQAELDFDGVITKITMKEELDDSDTEKLTKYVDELKEEISNLENDLNDTQYELDEAEGRISDLEDEIEEEKDYQNKQFRDLIQEIVDDQWKYTTVQYNTKEKIIDRLDFILRYQ